MQKRLRVTRAHGTIARFAGDHMLLDVIGRKSVMVYKSGSTEGCKRCFGVQRTSLPIGGSNS